MKTSEMIAMLENNPKLRFKCCNPIENGTEHIIAYIADDGCLRIRTDEYGDDCIISLTDEWELIKSELKPVSFIEAIKAYENSKKIECKVDDCPTLNGTFILEKDAYYKGGGFDVVNTSRVPIGTKEILEGKWYIVEDEENE